MLRITLALALLVALAVPSFAFSGGSATSNGTFSLFADTPADAARRGLQISSVSGGIYADDILTPGSNAATTRNRSAAGSFNGVAGNGLGAGDFDGSSFVLSSHVDATLTGGSATTNYDQFYGYRYSFTVTNDSDEALGAYFLYHTERDHVSTVTGSPYDGVTGERARSYSYGGIFDNTSGVFSFESIVIDTSVPTDPNPYSTTFEYFFGLVLQPGASHEFRVFSGSEAELTNFQAVPEPASFALLGVGALALLRRRRAA